MGLVVHSVVVACGVAHPIHGVHRVLAVGVASVVVQVHAIEVLEMALVLPQELQVEVLAKGSMVLLPLAGARGMTLCQGLKQVPGLAAVRRRLSWPHLTLVPVGHHCGHVHYYLHQKITVLCRSLCTGVCLIRFSTRFF